MTSYLVRIELRRHRWSLVLLALLTAAVVGVALASLAGARRAETAFDRYLEVLRSPDAAAFGDAEALDRLSELDPVEAAVDFELVAALPAMDDEGFYPLVASEGGALGRERMRAPVVDGRHPDPGAPFEVALSERTARRLRVDVGDSVPLVTLTPKAQAAWEAGEEVEPDGPPLALDVVGIVRDPGDIGSRESDITLTFLTAAFREAVPADDVGFVGRGTMVALRDGHELDDLARLLEGEDVELDRTLSVESSQQQIAPTLQAIATSTRIFGLVAALAGLIALGQAITRMHLSARTDDATLDALGATRRARWHRLFLPVTIATTAGALLGGVIAVGLSVLFPLGLARRADPHLGLDVDGFVLATGLAVTVLLLAGATALLANWGVRHAESTERPPAVSRSAVILADLGAPPSAVTGLTMAAGTPGHPGRIAVGGTMLSVLGVLAALVFSASVDRLAGDPALYGWGWDAVIEGADLTDVGEDVDALAERLDGDRDVEAAATLYTQVPVTLDDRPTYATVVREVHSALAPVVVDGTAPVADDEVAVGRDDLEALGASIGDDVELMLGGEVQPARISGVVALPVPEDGGSSASGVLLSPTTPEIVLDHACEASDSCTRTIAIALRDGADVDAFADRYGDVDRDIEVATPVPPGEVDRLTAVEHLPRYLAIFLAGLAAAAISFATATTVRQRRRDLAMLRVIGMTGRQVRAVVIVLVLAITAAGAVIGGGLGLIVGRQVWRAVANSVSLPFAPSIPVVAAVVVPLAALLLAQAVASTSRRAAGRVPTALVLRTE